MIAEADRGTARQKVGGGNACSQQLCNREFRRDRIAFVRRALLRRDDYHPCQIKRMGQSSRTGALPRLMLSSLFSKRS